MVLRQRAVLVVVPALLLTVGGCWRSTSDRPLPAVTVETAYPGANAQVVADTIAAPIEQQVNGVENMVRMTSRSANDGSYRLTVTFKQGTDLNLAQVLVQNRVSLALPILPDLVKRDGVTCKKASPGLLMMVAVSSPEGRYDTLYLGNYAAIQVQDELARVPGVNDVVLSGPHDVGVTVWLDPEKLAARGLTARDVTRALEEQNVEVAGGGRGRPPGKGQEDRIVGKTRGRLTDLDEFGNIILKADAGQPVRLQDVARVELGVQSGPYQATLNGKPAVLLGLYTVPQARPRQVGAAVADRVAQLGTHCPEGVRLDVAFDFASNLEGRSTASDYLLIDVSLPPGASAERVGEAVRHCDAIVREVAGVQDVLALSGNPFDRRPDRPCLLVRLAPAGERSGGREDTVRRLRARLSQVEEMALRLRDLSAPGGFPRCGYAIDLAVQGGEADRVRELAAKLAARLAESQKLTDVSADPDSDLRPQLSVDVDRTKAATLGVSMQDIMTTLQVHFGWKLDNGPGHPGRTLQVKVPPGANGGDQARDIQRLKVRNAQGDMVPLGALVQVREVSGPEAVDRLDCNPMVEITANPAAGVSASQARALCESLAEEVRKELGLPAEYQLTWLR
jgi:multidrug efflux pump subunit AcrB